MKLDITALPIKAEEFFSYLKNQIGYMDSTLKNIRKIVETDFIPFIKEEDGDIELAYGKFVESVKLKNVSSARINYYKICAYRFYMYVLNLNYEIQPLFPKYKKPKLEYLKEEIDLYLSNCKNNKPRTIENKTRILYKYAYFLESNGVKEIKKINLNVTLDFINGERNKDYPSYIRGFLEYLYDNDKIDTPLNLLLMNVKKKKRLPSVYSLEEIKKIEDGFEKESETGLRDYCIYLLTTELGIRIGDIVNLKFENINFESKIVGFKQIKTNVELRLPLSDKFITYFIKYVEKYRNDNLPYLFVTVLPPIRKISVSAFRFNLSLVFLKTDIHCNGRKHGPHSFRSSLVSNMLNNDVPYEVIRKVVGHTSETAISHYAKIDIEKLKIYALEPIDFNENIKNMLEGEYDV